MVPKHRPDRSISGVPTLPQLYPPEPPPQALRLLPFTIGSFIHLHAHSTNMSCTHAVCQSLARCWGYGTVPQTSKDWQSMGRPHTKHQGRDRARFCSRVPQSQETLS